MATYIGDISDRLPNQELFTPNYEFLQKSYALKQAQYDQGFDQFESQMGSLINADLNNPENIKFKDEFFKAYNNKLKSVSALDLTKTANIDRALAIFDPLVEDKEFLYDSNFSKSQKKARQNMSLYRDSTDPDKQKFYNKYAEEAINIADEKMMTAKRGDGSIFKVKPQNFVVFHDVTDYLNKAAKEQKIDVVFTASSRDGYLKIQTNGKDAEQPFIDWAKSQIGEKFDEQFNTISLVDNHNAISNISQRLGVSYDEARTYYAKNYFNSAANKLLEDLSSIESNLLNVNSKLENYKKVPDSEKKKVNVSNLENYKSMLEDYKSRKETQISSVKNHSPSVLENFHSSILKEDFIKDWGSSLAMAKEQVEFKPDEAYLKFAEMAQKDKFHYEDLNESRRQFNITREDKIKEIEDKNAAIRTGDYTPVGSIPATEILNSSVKNASIGIIDATYGHDGISEIALSGDKPFKNILDKLYYSYKKGSVLPLQQTDIDILRNSLYKIGLGPLYERHSRSFTLGTKKNDGSVGPVGPEYIKNFLSQLSPSLYSKSMQSNTGMHPAMVNAFNLYTGFSSNEQLYRNSLESIHNTISDSPEMKTKAKIVDNYYGIPIYDISTLEPHQKDLLDKNLEPYFKKMQLPTGGIYDYTANAKIHGLFMKYLPEKDKKDITSMSSSSFIDNFKNTRISFDAVNNKVILNINGVGLKKNDSGDDTSYTIEVPYDEAMNSEDGYIRNLTYANTINLNNSTMFSPLITGVTESMSSPEFFPISFYARKSFNSSGTPGYTVDITNPNTKTVNSIFSTEEGLKPLGENIMRLNFLAKDEEE